MRRHARVDESWLEPRSMRKTADVRQLGRPSLREEKEWIESALAEADGRVPDLRGAAAALGIRRSAGVKDPIAAHRQNRFRAKNV
jgi:hypothetical protein